MDQANFIHLIDSLTIHPADFRDLSYARTQVYQYMTNVMGIRISSNEEVIKAIREIATHLSEENNPYQTFVSNLLDKYIISENMSLHKVISNMYDGLVGSIPSYSVSTLISPYAPISIIQSIEISKETIAPTMFFDKKSQQWSNTPTNYPSYLLGNLPVLVAYQVSKQEIGLCMVPFYTFDSLVNLPLTGEVKHFYEAIKAAVEKAERKFSVFIDDNEGSPKEYLEKLFNQYNLLGDVFSLFYLVMSNYIPNIPSITELFPSGSYIENTDKTIAEEVTSEEVESSLNVAESAVKEEDGVIHSVEDLNWSIDSIESELTDEVFGLNANGPQAFPHLGEITITPVDEIESISDLTQDGWLEVGKY